MKSLLATSFDQYRNARSLLAISINLESHLAIPLPITKYKNTCVVSLWRVTCPNGKRKEWSHYYGWPTQGGEWPHYYGWPTQVKKKWRMVSLYGWPTQEKWWSHCMGDLPRKNDGLIVWVTNPRKMMVSLYGWLTQEKWWSHCMGDEPKKNDGLIVWVTYPRGRILSKLHVFLRNSFNTRSLLATFLDECRSTRSFLATFIEIQDPFWRSPLSKQLGIPSGDSFYTKAEIWGPFWWPPSKYEIPSGDLNNLKSHLAIPFYRMLSMSSFLLAWFENHYLLFLLF